MSRPVNPIIPQTWEKRVLVREVLFTFKDQDDWIRHAQGMFRAFGHTAESTICIDLRGMICARGKHFNEARYPITVYAIDDAPFEPAGMIGERQPTKEPRQ